MAFKDLGVQVEDIAAYTNAKASDLCARHSCCTTLSNDDNISGMWVAALAETALNGWGTESLMMCKTTAAHPVRLP